jgi:hypothetical protein
MQRKFVQTIHVPGTMAAALNVRFAVPSGCKLVHVSTVASNATDTTFDLGDSTNTDGFVDGGTIGVSDTPAELDAPSDFDGALSDGAFPQLDDGDIFVLVTDISGTTDAADFTAVLTFVEGGV